MRLPLRRLYAWVLVLGLACPGLAFARDAKPAEEGVQVGKPSALRNLVPAADLERQSAGQYGQLMRQAAAKGMLAPAEDPQVRRLRAIADRLIPNATRFNPRANQWKWEINLIRSPQINAFCMPGGKIAFFSGILQTLQLSDDEVAAVMGHEIAHALREHARERIAKGQLTQIGSMILGELVGGGRYADAFHVGGSLLTLKFSRDDESEADLVGLELAARAGYDPRAGVSLWRKMGQVSKGSRLDWLSTHPSGPNRIQEIERHLPQVLPLYTRSADQRTPR